MGLLVPGRAQPYLDYIMILSDLSLVACTRYTLVNYNMILSVLSFNCQDLFLSISSLMNLSEGSASGPFFAYKASKQSS